jgi:hypothetical protein
VIIGGNASVYPADNYFPPSIDQVGFYSRDTGDYRLATKLPGGAPNPYKNAGTDNRDLGYAHPIDDARIFVRPHAGADHT